MLEHIGDPWWEEVLLLYAGQTSDASMLLQQLLGLSEQGILPDDLFHTNLITAGHCLAAYPTVRQVALRQEVLTRLFDLLTTTRYALTRKQVAETLAEIGGREANAHLLKLLADERVNSVVRWSIAAALGRFASDEAPCCAFAIPRSKSYIC